MSCITEKLNHGWWVVSHEQKLWLPRGELPYGGAASSDLVSQHVLQIDEWQGEPVWLIQQRRRHDMGSIRQVIDLDVGPFRLAGRGTQLAEFYRSRKCYGYYGHKMYPSKTKWTMLCSHCHERYYPQTVPCIIAAICRDDSILLTQYIRHHDGVHAVLAGFIEMDEIPKQAVAREVMEENGTRARNLCHVTPQP